MGPRHANNRSMELQKAALKVVKVLKEQSTHTLKLDLGKRTQFSAHVNANWGSEAGPGRRSETGLVALYGSALM